MASVKRCRNCGPNSELETDYSAGNVVCQRCGQIVEEGILVSEIGFAESAGGRVHVQGTFVSNYSTGIAGTRGSGRGGEQNVANIKASGASSIEQIAQSMHLSSVISRGAIRFFSLAVDNKFNRGRKKQYIFASCLYLQCRLKKDSHMLIDFSEYCHCNVFELGATYLKLRSILNLLDPMPEVDPAIYNIRFAHRLNFGPLVNTVAADASRLVRRFRADWMTQGRRPAGVCGACLIIAGRMSNFLRTPEEVAQVVRVHPNTVKKRLLEFADTEMAKKTIGEWRSLTDDQLDQFDKAAKPPVVREQERKREREDRKRRLATGEIEEDEEDADEDDKEEDEEGGIHKKIRLDKGKGRASSVDEITGALKAAAHDFENTSVSDGQDEDDNLEPLAPGDFVSQLESARDDPSKAKEERRREKAALLSEIKGLREADEEEKIDEDEYDMEEDGEMDDLERLASDAENSVAEDEEELYPDLDPTQLKTLTQADAAQKSTIDNFTAWDDESAVIALFEEKFFSGEKALYQDKMGDRIKMWWASRDPKEVYYEMEAVKRARWLREKNAKQEDVDLGDLDDEELEELYVLDEDAKQARARMWLSANGGWLEQEREKQEVKEANARAKPSKPRKKRKRTMKLKGPHNSAPEAMVHMSKKIQSKRVNFDVLRGLGLPTGDFAGASGLMTMDDEDEKGEDEEDEEEKGEDDDYQKWTY